MKDIFSLIVCFIAVLPLVVIAQQKTNLSLAVGAKLQ
jgi:hypothetical protein